MKYFILFVALLVLSACDMEKSFRTNEELSYDIYNQIGPMLADDGYQIWDEWHKERRAKMRELDDSPVYKENIYLATMKIMDSYGIDTNRFDRSTINISVIGDNFETNDRFVKSNTPIIISKIDNAKNIALVKMGDYKKYLKPIIPEDKKSRVMFHDFIFYGLSKMFFETKTTAKFNISYVVGPLIAQGKEYYISKKNGSWVIDSSRVTWVS